MRSARRSRVALLAGALAYVALLQWSYRHIVSPAYSWLGMVHRPLPWALLLAQSLLALIPAFWLPGQIHKPSHLQWWLLYLTVIIPTCIVPFHTIDHSSTSLLAFAALLIVCFGFMCRFSTLRTLRLPRVPLCPAVFWLGIGVLTATTYGCLWITVGGFRTLPSVVEVYTRRAELGQMLGEAPRLLGYLYWWQGMLLNPLIIAAGLVRPRLVLIGLGFVLQVALFAATALQTFVLAFFMQLGFGVLVLCFRRHLGVAFLYAMVACTATASIWGALTLGAFAPMTFLQRWIFVPGFLMGYYLDFFSQHPPTRLGHSILSGLFAYPYDLLPSRVIGREFLSQGDAPGVYTNATANLWADAYSAFGFAGVIGFSLFAGVIMWVVDSAWRRDRRTGLLLMCLVGQAFAGEGVLTSLLTGGLAPLILIGLMAPPLTSRNAPASATRKEELCPTSST